MYIDKLLKTPFSLDDFYIYSLKQAVILVVLPSDKLLYIFFFSKKRYQQNIFIPIITKPVSQMNQTFPSKVLYSVIPIDGFLKPVISLISRSMS